MQNSQLKINTTNMMCLMVKVWVRWCILIFVVFISSPVSSWRNEMISRFASVVREVVLDEEIAEPKIFLAPGTGWHASAADMYVQIST